MCTWCVPCVYVVGVPCVCMVNVPCSSLLCVCYFRCASIVFSTSVVMNDLLFCLNLFIVSQINENEGYLALLEHACVTKK